MAADPALIQKTNAARAAAAEVTDGMRVGLGSGSTSALMIEALGLRVAAGEIRITGVCTSREVEALATRFAIPIEEPSFDKPADIYIDGADQIDGNGVMIKGGGGALLREKIVAMNARRRIIMVDPRKPVERLGVGFPLPVDVVAFGSRFVAEIIRRRVSPGAALRLTPNGDVLVNSDGHHIVDCPFPTGIENPPQMSELLRSIPGVVEVGLFFGFCDELIIGLEEGVERRTFRHHVEVYE